MNFPSLPWLSKTPSFCHITHAKAGSTWIDAILRSLFGGKVAPRIGGDLSRVLNHPGKIYSAAFLTHEETLACSPLASLPRFLVIRDLRDTLVSRYFSVLVSHPLDLNGAIARQRSQLNSISKEAGLDLLLKDGLLRSVQIQRSWAAAGEKLWHYEDLITNDLERFTEILSPLVGTTFSEKKLQCAVETNRFEQVFARKLGEQDVNSHGRTGAPGDWKNHFTRKLADRFVQLYGDTLVATGYEANHDWVEAVPS